jgi:hypothetical protein
MSYLCQQSVLYMFHFQKEADALRLHLAILSADQKYRQKFIINYDQQRATHRLHNLKTDRTLSTAFSRQTFVNSF